MTLGRYTSQFTGHVVVAQRLNVPISVHLPSSQCLDYEPGDWLMMDWSGAQFVFNTHEDFCKEFLPNDAQSQLIMRRDDFDLVVSEKRPALTLDEITLGRKYGVTWKPRPEITKPSHFRGVLTYQDDKVVVFYSTRMGTIEIPLPAFRHALPLHPKDEPCLLRSKA